MPLRLYTDLAAWWPLLSPPPEYLEEADDLVPRILAALKVQASASRPETLLELGSGGGSLAFHLKRHAFLLRSADGSIGVEHDRHIEGLFSRGRWLEWFAAAGIPATSALDAWNRDVFIGVRKDG